MSQKTRTNDLAAQGREAAEASRGNGVDDANWLSQLLARASRDDEPGGAALIRSVAKVAEEAPPKRAIATKSGLQEAERKAYATLISAKELHNKLSVVVQDRKEDALQNSWPSPDAALDLVRKAAEALRVMEQRAAALESYALKVVKEAREELASVAAKASCLSRARRRGRRDCARTSDTAFSLGRTRDALRSACAARRGGSQPREGLDGACQRRHYRHAFYRGTGLQGQTGRQGRRRARDREQAQERTFGRNRASAVRRKNNLPQKPGTALRSPDYEALIRDPVTTANGPLLLGGRAVTCYSTITRTGRDVTGASASLA